MKHKNFWIYGIVVFTILGLGGAIAFGIIPLENLPSQFYGALVGTVITAIITILLLQGQTQTEENKERNVKVFEKKSDVFNNFIEQLWKVWEDRSVSLEELNELLKLVSKDIIPYAQPESSSIILSELNKIADKANPNESDSSDSNVTKQIQQSIFTIINVLSKEIGLGGEIKDDISHELDALEGKILPYLNKKNYINQIKELVKSKSMGALTEFEEDSDNILWWKIGKNTGVWLRVGDSYKNGIVYITFWSEFYGNREYLEYRYAVRGEWKDWLKNNYKDEKGVLLNFNDLRNGNLITNNKIEELTDKIVEFCNNAEIDKQTISEIIEKVTKINENTAK
ncbi:hypothetical protein LJB98_04395 [Bacteroidales bacterium OttesenSCG-928-M11]|nr:hypothetical protein [Bacteroidales bacterium OttesenSCG-928-M11]